MVNADEVDVFWNDHFLDYEPPGNGLGGVENEYIATSAPHPDRPSRAENIRHILQSELDGRIKWHEGEPATIEQVERTHSRTHVERMYHTSAESTFQAARHAAGSAIQAAASALDCGRPAYAPVRPSGHHATPTATWGFCVFNNAAIAANWLLETEAVDRILLLDWDIHHGNGTQECFYDREDVLYVSVHDDSRLWNLPPDNRCGDVDERGVRDGEGYNINVPLPPGISDEGYRLVLRRIVEPVVEEYSPDLLLVSAGQDCGIVDIFGRNLVTKDGFEEMGEMVHEFAEEHTDAGVAIVQEGGYQVTHLARSTLAILEGILGVESNTDRIWDGVSGNRELAAAAVERVVESHASDWSFE